MCVERSLWHYYRLVRAFVCCGQSVRLCCTLHHSAGPARAVLCAQIFPPLGCTEGPSQASVSLRTACPFAPALGVLQQTECSCHAQLPLHQLELTKIPRCFRGCFEFLCVCVSVMACVHSLPIMCGVIMDMCCYMTLQQGAALQPDRTVAFCHWPCSSFVCFAQACHCIALCLICCTCRGAVKWPPMGGMCFAAPTVMCVLLRRQSYSLPRGSCELHVCHKRCAAAWVVLWHMCT